MSKTKQKYEEISYQELARRVGDCVLNNYVRQQSEDIDSWEVFNGSIDYCYEHDNKEECEKFNYNDCKHEYYEIYQDYIITRGGAEYLQENTNEILFYNEKLDMYMWGITHYGTLWSGVYTKVKTY